MLHRNRAIQDENDLRHNRGKLFGGSDGPHTGKKPHSKGGKTSFDPENQAITKSSKPLKTMPRKALGDITNATPAGKALGKAKPAYPHVTPLLKPEAKPEAKSIDLWKSRIDLWAGEGIEHQAGKGWKEMQRESEARQAEEINARIRTSLTQRPHVRHFGEKGSQPVQSWRRFSSVKIPKKPPSRPSSPISGGFLDDFEDFDLSDVQFSLAVPCPQLACIDV